MNAMIPAPPPPLNFSDLALLAEAIAKSNLFGIKTKDQALVLMMIARSEGRDPVEAARDYDIIQGKPAKKAEAMLRDFLTAGGKVEWHELSDTKADATFVHPQTGSVRIDWDLARANTAGFGGKDMWKKFPRQMLRSRVVSEGVRTLWPLATSGMYVPEEQADIPPRHNGPTVEHDEREAINEAVPLKAAAADMPRAPRVADPQVYETAKPHRQMPDGPVDPNPVDLAPPRRTRGQFLDALSIALNDAKSHEEANKILLSEDVQRARETFTNGLKERLDGLVSRALNKWWSEPPDADALPEIVGEEHAAG